MILFLTLFIIIKSDYYDANGVRFNNENKEKLEKTPSTLTEYIIPPETQVICGGTQSSYSAFAPCQDVITKISFSEGSKIHTIEQYGFYNLRKLTKLDMSMCVEITSFTNAAFMKCSSIETFILPPNLKSISGGAFRALTSLKRLDFPSSFEEIGDYSTFEGALQSCTSLTEITWGENPSIQKIGSCGLKDTNLSRLHIPKSLKSIAAEALLGAPIASFDVDSDGNKFYGEGTRLYNAQKTTLILISELETGIIHLPDSVTTISSGALMGSYAETVILSDNIRNIEFDAFMYSHIHYLTLPKSITAIGNRALLKCTSLKTLIINASITTIPREFVSGCTALNEIVLPSTVVTILEYAFKECSTVDYIFIPKSVKSISSGVFAGINKSAIIEIENGSAIQYEDGYFYNSDYTVMTSCIKYDSFVAIIKSTVKEIGSYCFNGLSVTGVTFTGEPHLKTIGISAFASSNLASIDLPSTLTTIQKDAFYKCTLLTQVNMQTGLQTIEAEAFLGSGITQAIFPASLVSIGEKAFESSQLSIVTFGKSLQTIGVRAFASTKIRSIQISISVSNIGDSAFAGSELQTISFTSPTNPDSTNYETIPMYAFKGCQKLTEINFAPESKVIGDNCFEGCSSLKTLLIGAGVENISTNAFKDCILLESVGIPETSALKIIESLAFDGCSKLKHFNVSERNPSFHAEDGVLFNRDVTKIVLYLPAHERKEFDVPDTVKEIEIYAFQNAANLEIIHLPERIKRVGYGSFSGCIKLRHINIPSELNDIGVNAFYRCESLVCGSIEHDASKRDYLYELGVPLEGLTPCPTLLFTLHQKGDDKCSPFLLASVFLSEEKNGNNQQSADIE